MRVNTIKRISIRLSALLVLGALATPLHSQACLWDRDTLWMETQEFPLALELITGKFRRHSPVYYEWRIEQSLVALKTAPGDLSVMDDLGVAYDKLGQHEKAIATGRKALGMNPERYESNANLGTFLIHKGALTEGLVYLKRAIEINPDAHFGRERYQIHLVEYVLSRRNAAGELVLPLMGDTSVPLYSNFDTFDRYVMKQDGGDAYREGGRQVSQYAQRLSGRGASDSGRRDSGPDGSRNAVSVAACAAPRPHLIALSAEGVTK